MQVKVIHLIKRVEQIDKEIHELHEMVAGIDSARSYRDTMKIAAEKQINDLIGERVKLMELTIANPPEFLSKHVENEPRTNTLAQPRVSLDALQGSANSTFQPAYEQRRQPEPSEVKEQNPLKGFARLMTVEEILPKGEPPSRSRKAEKPATRSRADILRDLPPLQY